MINESEHYRGPLYRIKQLTGNDQLSGREKNVQGSFDFTFGGLVVAASNHPFSSSEPSNALKRRVRQIETPNTIKEKDQIPLLYWCNNDKRWKGHLAYELSEIFNWATYFKVAEAGQYVKETFFETINEGLVNPLELFIQENFDLDKTDKHLAVGFTKTKDFDHVDVQRAINEDKIYPVYRYFCELSGEKPIGHTLFSQAFVETARIVFDDVEIERKRSNSQTYIHNVTFKDKLNFDITFYKDGEYNPEKRLSEPQSVKLSYSEREHFMNLNMREQIDYMKEKKESMKRRKRYGM